MPTARTRKQGPPRRWRIEGKTYREEDLPPGVKHPIPGKAKFYVEVDEKLLKSIKTPHMVNKRTMKAELENGIPLDLVLSFTDRGIVMSDMYALKVRLPWKSRKRDEWGDHERTMREALVGCEQKIYYKDIATSPDPKDPMHRTIQIAHAPLVTPMWRDWRPKRGVPVGDELAHKADFKFSRHHARQWLEPAV